MYVGNNVDSFVIINIPFSPSRVFPSAEKSTMLPLEGDEIVELQSGCNNGLKL